MARTHERPRETREDVPHVIPTGPVIGNLSPSRERQSNPPPYLVEVLGPAASGKSTVTRSLRQHEPDWKIADFIDTRTPEHLRYVFQSMPRLVPILGRGLADRPRLTWREFKLLVYVTEWHRFLERKSEHRHGITLLDQGPIYALVRLRAEAGGFTGAASFTRWWDEMLERWTHRLGAIVYLDAADRVLWTRVNNRDQAHTTKGMSEAVGREFLTRYRRLFEEVLERVGASGAPEILRFDTGVTDAEPLASQIRRILQARLSSQTQRAGSG